MPTQQLRSLVSLHLIWGNIEGWRHCVDWRKLHQSIVYVSDTKRIHTDWQRVVLGPTLKPGHNSSCYLTEGFALKSLQHKYTYVVCREDYILGRKISKAAICVPGRNCAEVIFTFWCLIGDYMRDCKALLLWIIDISKAFDPVDRKPAWNVAPPHKLFCGDTGMDLHDPFARDGIKIRGIFFLLQCTLCLDSVAKK